VAYGFSEQADLRFTLAHQKQYNDLDFFRQVCMHIPIPSMDKTFPLTRFVRLGEPFRDRTKRSVVKRSYNRAIFRSILLTQSHSLSWHK